MRDVRFAAFALLYAVALVLDHAQMSTRLGANPGTVAVLAAIPVLLRPASAVALLVLAATQLVFFASEFPHLSNLGLLHLATCAVLLAGFATASGSRRRAATGAELLDEVAPALRLLLVVVYAWSCWHKLNADFLDPELSCGVVLYDKVRWGLSFLPLPPGASIAGFLIATTLVVEGALPVLLLLRRTRALGVAAGVGFHVFLGFGSYYAFSAAAIALLLLFAPDGWVERLARRWDPSRPRHRRAHAAVAAGALVLFVAARVAYSWHADRPALENLAGIDVLGNQFTQRVWWIYVPAAAASLAVVRIDAERSARELVLSGRRSFLLVAALFLVNGASPYLGLKTEYSFAMYSNLRTEAGRSNHLLVRSPLYLADYQRDLVQVLESDDPDLDRIARRGFPVPFVDLRNRVHAALDSGAPDVAVTYERDGRRRAIPSVRADPELSRPPAWYERLLTFREIRFGANTCAH